jgi:hypothetical protein
MAKVAIKGTNDVLAEKSFSDCILDLMPGLIWAAGAGVTVGNVDGAVALDSFRQLIGWDEVRFAALCAVFQSDKDDDDE